MITATLKVTNQPYSNKLLHMFEEARFEAIKALNRRYNKYNPRHEGKRWKVKGE